MNELEKEKALLDFRGEIETWDYDSCAKGFEVAIDLNLSVLFIIWLHSFESRTEEERALVKETAHLSIEKTAMALYNYWINNKYKK